MSDERDPTAPLVPDDDDSSWPSPPPEQGEAYGEAPLDDVEFWPALADAPPVSSPESSAPGAPGGEPHGVAETQAIEVDPTTQYEQVQVHHAPPIEHGAPAQAFPARGREETAAALEELRAHASPPPPAPPAGAHPPQDESAPARPETGAHPPLDEGAGARDEGAQRRDAGAPPRPGAHTYDEGAPPQRQAGAHAYDEGALTADERGARAAHDAEEELALPSIEELTFGGRATTAIPVPSAASRDVVPLHESAREMVPRTLSKRRAATLAAFAEALLPRGGTLEPSASDVGVAERLDALAASFEPSARRMLSRHLTFFEWQSLFSRSMRPFSKIPAAQRAAAIARAGASALLPRRAATDLLKFFSANQWASSPAIERGVGFTYGCETGDAPRDGERLEVVGYPQIDRDHTEECDVVVIGSGAGGAVVAKEFAEIGLSVVVIEEGNYFTRADFTGPPFERFLRFYRKQGMTAALGSPSIPMPMAMAVGGSTLVGSGTSFRTPDRVLSRWEREFALPQIDPESMRPFFDRVEKIQRVQPTPDEIAGNNGRAFRRGAEALGLNGAPVRRNVDSCRGCGVCTTGCPTGALLGTHLSYLPRAQRSGATIYANAHALTIDVEGGRATGITAKLLDPATREPKASLKVRAKVVVLAAGAIHTPALLAANALANTSGRLGRSLRIHPAASVGALFGERLDGWKGVPQSFYVDDWHESHDLMIEASSSVPSMSAGMLPDYGADLKEMVARAPYTASARVFVSDTSSGRVISRPGREPVISYSLNRPDTRRLVRGIAHVAEIFLAAGARAVHTGLPGLDPVENTQQLVDLHEEAVKPGSLRLTAQHPVGTARMGVDPTTSVTGPYGEVHGVKNLFVADASVLPGCPTVDPQITIMAFATRTADHVARYGARYF